MVLILLKLRFQWWRSHLLTASPLPGKPKAYRYVLWQSHVDARAPSKSTPESAKFCAWRNAHYVHLAEARNQHHVLPCLTARKDGRFAGSIGIEPIDLTRGKVGNLMRFIAVDWHIPNISHPFLRIAIHDRSTIRRPFEINRI